MSCRDGRGIACSNEVEVELCAPDGIAWGRMCRKHAVECVEEYAEKLHESWTIREVVQNVGTYA
jgi:hypothetical protein